MATDAASPSFSFDSDSDFFKSLSAQARAVATPIASLRLTVTLFAFSVLLIFIGTLAQAQPGMNMWRVIDKYFRSYLVMVDVSVFFVPGWFPQLHSQIPEWLKFPFPGGFSIGLAMAANLVAAHFIRFKIQAKGPALVLGSALLVVGTVITYFVIASGHNTSGLQGQPPFAWSALWYGVRGIALTCTVASVVALALAKAPSIGQRILFLLLALVSGALAFVAFRFIPGESSLRILWQLIQGGLSGLILLAGCYAVFKKRAGIVLLHVGIGLMMFSEFFVSRYVEEGRMTIFEGETVNYVRDIREVELAIVDPTKADTEDVIVVPGTRLRPKRGLFGDAKETVVVKDEKLPFDIHVEKYLANTKLLLDLKELDENLATKGTGLEVGVVELPASDGTESEVDLAAAYIRFTKRDSDESLGTYLLSQDVSSRGIAENVEVDGKKYEVSLRFKREYKPYRVSLKDVRKDDYVGTDTPMNYSSDVVLTKASLDSQDESKVGDFHIWMNNPLRYSGETFYQSGYDSGKRTNTPEATTLQVVSNTGWMMPYIGCMLVAVGMTFHSQGPFGDFWTRASACNFLAKKNLRRVGWTSWCRSRCWCCSAAMRPQNSARRMIRKPI